MTFFNKNMTFFAQPSPFFSSVVGPLCENCDKFAVQRQLPEIAMGYNYNGKTRSAELLLRPDGSVIQIRRAETLADLFATLDLDALSLFKQGCPPHLTPRPGGAA